MKITLIELIGRGACGGERDLFYQCFGSELELPTDLQAQEKLAVELARWDFSIFWAGSSLMEPEKYLEWKDYEYKENNTYVRACNCWCMVREKAFYKYRENCWLKMIQLMVQ